MNADTIWIILPVLVLSLIYTIVQATGIDWKKKGKDFFGDPTFMKFGTGAGLVIAAVLLIIFREVVGYSLTTSAPLMVITFAILAIIYAVVVRQLVKRR